MKKGPSFWGLSVISVLALLLISPNLTSAEITKGNILGFLYSEDGTTPVAGALVKARNISSGTVYESSISDVYGVFKIEGVESGIYIYGVKTDSGEFNSDGLIGIKVDENETAKMAITLTPFEEKIRENIAAGLEANPIEGEILVGRILGFDAENGYAEVYILQGMLSQKDKIHALGVQTDFYQTVEDLSIGESKVKTSAAGETANLKLNNSAMPGDFLYVVADKGFALLAVVPVGVAALVGTSAAIKKVDNSAVKDQETAASPYRK